MLMTQNIFINLCLMPMHSTPEMRPWNSFSFRSWISLISLLEISVRNRRHMVTFFGARLSWNHTNSVLRSIYWLFHRKYGSWGPVIGSRSTDWRHWGPINKNYTDRFKAFRSNDRNYTDWWDALRSQNIYFKIMLHYSGSIAIWNGLMSS